MSSFDKPQIPPAEIQTPGSQFPSFQSELTRNLDIAAARQFFQPTGAEAALPPISTGGGTEAAILSKAGAMAAPGLETALMPGGESAAAMAAKSAINPMIQVIMRLPGVLGAGTGFFEFLAALFMPGTNLIEAFNPVTWANQLAGGIASLKTSMLTGAATEHVATSLNMLPANAHIFQNIGLSNLQMNGLQFQGLENSMNIDGMSLSNQFRVDDLNISSPLDIKKPQFEMSGTSAMNKLALRHDGLLSGPSVNPDFSPAHLSGAPRMFSDQISSSSTFNSAVTSNASTTIVSASGVPAGSSSALNIGSNSFSQDVGSLPANYQLGEGAISGPGMSGNVGYQMSGAQPSLDSAPRLAPSGRVSDTLGQPNVIAQNGSMDYYRPSMNSVPTEAAPVSDASAASSGSSGLQGLRAEPMSILKKPIGTNHGHGVKTVDSIGHQSKPSVHHSSSSTSSNSRGAMDQISHRTTPKAYGQTRDAHVTSPARHDNVTSAVPNSEQHFIQPNQQPMDSQVIDGQGGQAPVSADQVQQAGDQHLQAQAGSDQMQPGSDAHVEAVENYTVKHGDCLWDIAKKHFGDGTKWTEIYKMNADVIGANPDLIHTGLELKLPGLDNAHTASAGHYSVKPGDNLWDIAHDQLGDGTKWGEIYKANAQVIGDNPRLIMPGQELQMPGGQQLVSQAPAATAAPTGVPADAGTGLQTPAANTISTQAATPASYTQVNPAAAQPMIQQPAAAAPQTISMRPEVQPSPMYPENPGPGAAVAATLDAPPSPIVSSSLAPDLSFLGQHKK